MCLTKRRSFYTTVYPLFLIEDITKMLLLVVGIIILIVILNRKSSSGNSGRDRPNRPRTTDLTERSARMPRSINTAEKRAGNRGEIKATRVIQSVLRGGDRLFTHFSIETNGKRAEMDNIVVNNYGVFIIEVKNWNGMIAGSADDTEWIQYKTTYESQTYANSRKNPIKQVNGQVYALKQYLKSNGVNVWIDGYVWMLQKNSPISNEQILHNASDINKAIHTVSRIALDETTIDRITDLLENKQFL